MMFIKGFKAVFVLYFATIALAAPAPQSNKGMSC